jgi:hypothetical protein
MSLMDTFGEGPCSLRRPFECDSKIVFFTVGVYSQSSGQTNVTRGPAMFSSPKAFLERVEQLHLVSLTRAMESEKHQWTTRPDDVLRGAKLGLSGGAECGYMFGIQRRTKS